MSVPASLCAHFVRQALAKAPSQGVRFSRRGLTVQLTKTSSGAELSPRQKKEADVLARLAQEWEIESANALPNCLALEYRLRNRSPQPDGGRAYCIVRGLDTETRDQFLEAHFRRQLASCPIRRTA